MSVERFKIGFICSAVRREYDSLDGSVRAVVDKGMLRLALRADEIGKPLSGALTGCRELKKRDFQNLDTRKPLFSRGFLVCNYIS